MTIFQGSLAAAAPGEALSARPRQTQASAPSASKAARMRALTASVLQHLAIVVGEDADRHAPCLLTGKTSPAVPPIMPRSGSGPRPARKRVEMMAASGAGCAAVVASPRSLSMWTNHCGVLGENNRLLGAPAMRIRCGA